ncbi:M48 family metallopeptidase [Pseudogemmobacter sonorensis]|uniref:M48 family metallopeptidase n=1 Tax=Pseudogemmobacter sonorensis TaxID=2989681 RepID=UPI003689D7D8
MIPMILIPLAMALISAILITRFNLWKTRQDLTARSRPLNDPQILLQADRLARALDLPRIEVLELDDPEINGFADADGRVFLTRGFVRRHHFGHVSAEELASVIAHELGHVAHGHVKKRMRDATGHTAAQMMSNMLIARFLPFIGPWITARIAETLMALQSREHEYQADAWASALLIRSGIGTGPQKSLFRKLDQLVGRSGADGIPDWMRSHPRTEDRIKAIEANEARWLG